MSPKLPRINAVQLLRALKHDGWQPVRQNGSHITLKHPTKPGIVIVARHASVIIKPKTLETILKHARLIEDELRNLL